MIIQKNDEDKKKKKIWKREREREFSNKLTGY